MSPPVSGTRRDRVSGETRSGEDVPVRHESLCDAAWGHHFTVEEPCGICSSLRACEERSYASGQRAERERVRAGVESFLVDVSPVENGVYFTAMSAVLSLLSPDGPGDAPGGSARRGSGRDVIG